MRALVGLAVVVLAAGPARADATRPGAIGIVGGLLSGTGADAKRIGYGYYWFGGQASWQQMFSPTGRWGWTARATTIFGTLPQHWRNATAAQVDDLKTVQMDLTLGVRVRPAANPSRYVTLRVGGEALRTNQPIPPRNERAFLGVVASVGLDQYLGSSALLSLDVHYGMLTGGGPDQIALIAGIGLVGP